MLVGPGLAFLIFNLVVAEYSNEYDEDQYGIYDNSYSDYAEDSYSIGPGLDSGRVRRFGDVPEMTATRNMDEIREALKKILPAHQELFQDISQSPMVIDTTPTEPGPRQFEASSPLGASTQQYGFYEEVTLETVQQDLEAETEAVMYGLTPEGVTVIPLHSNIYEEQNRLTLEVKTTVLSSTTQPPVRSRYPPVRSTTHPPARSTIHPPVRSTIHPPARSTIHPPARSTIHPPVRSSTNPPEPSTTHLSIRSTTHPPVRMTTHPPVRLTTRLSVWSTTHPPVRLMSYPPVRMTTQIPVTLTTHSLVTLTTDSPVKMTFHPGRSHVTVLLTIHKPISTSLVPIKPIPVRSTIRAPARSMTSVPVRSSRLPVTSSPIQSKFQTMDFAPSEKDRNISQALPEEMDPDYEDDVSLLDDLGALRDGLPHDYTGEDRTVTDDVNNLRQLGGFPGAGSPGGGGAGVPGGAGAGVPGGAGAAAPGGAGAALPGGAGAAAPGGAGVAVPGGAGAGVPGGAGAAAPGGAGAALPGGAGAALPGGAGAAVPGGAGAALPGGAGAAAPGGAGAAAPGGAGVTVAGGAGASKSKTKKKTKKPTTTTKAYLVFDIESFLKILANLTYDYDTNLTDVMNMTLRNNTPTCPPPGYQSTTSTTTTTTTTEAYEMPGNVNNTVVAKCFMCGLYSPGIPSDTSCADAFAGDFLPLTPVDPIAKSKTSSFRKYCRYGEIYNYYENRTRPRSVYGRWTGGCSVRWTDLTGLYTQRSCRNRKRAVTGRHYASKRMAKLEMSLGYTEQGCIISPVATLLPLSRGVSLYARFHACVCMGNWCNVAARALPTLLTLTLALVVTLAARSARQLMT